MPATPKAASTVLSTCHTSIAKLVQRSVGDLDPACARPEEDLELQVQREGDENLHAEIEQFNAYWKSDVVHDDMLPEFKDLCVALEELKNYGQQAATTRILNALESYMKQFEKLGESSIFPTVTLDDWVRFLKLMSTEKLEAYNDFMQRTQHLQLLLTKHIDIFTSGHELLPALQHLLSKLEAFSICLRTVGERACTTICDNVDAALDEELWGGLRKRRKSFSVDLDLGCMLQPHSDENASAASASWYNTSPARHAAIAHSQSNASTCEDHTESAIFSGQTSQASQVSASSNPRDASEKEANVVVSSRIIHDSELTDAPSNAPSIGKADPCVDHVGQTDQEQATAIVNKCRADKMLSLAPRDLSEEVMAQKDGLKQKSQSSSSSPNSSLRFEVQRHVEHLTAVANKGCASKMRSPVPGDLSEDVTAQKDSTDPHITAQKDSTDPRVQQLEDDVKQTSQSSSSQMPSLLFAVQRRAEHLQEEAEEEEHLLASDMLPAKPVTNSMETFVEEPNRCTDPGMEALQDVVAGSSLPSSSSDDFLANPSIHGSQLTDAPSIGIADACVDHVSQTVEGVETAIAEAATAIADKCHASKTQRFEPIDLSEDIVAEEASTELGAPACITQHLEDDLNQTSQSSLSPRSSKHVTIAAESKLPQRMQCAVEHSPSDDPSQVPRARLQPTVPTVRQHVQNFRTSRTLPAKPGLDNRTNSGKHAVQDSGAESSLQPSPPRSREKKPLPSLQSAADHCNADDPSQMPRSRMQPILQNSRPSLESAAEHFTTGDPSQTPRAKVQPIVRRHLTNVPQSRTVPDKPRTSSKEGCLFLKQVKTLDFEPDSAVQDSGAESSFQTAAHASPPRRSGLPQVAAMTSASSMTSVSSDSKTPRMRWGRSSVLSQLNQALPVCTPQGDVCAAPADAGASRRRSSFGGGLPDVLGRRKSTDDTSSQQKCEDEFNPYCAFLFKGQQFHELFGVCFCCS